MKGSSVIHVGAARPPVRLVHAILLTVAGSCIVIGVLMLVFQESLREFFSEEPVLFDGYKYVPEFRRFPLFLSQIVGEVMIRGGREVVGRLVSDGMTFEDGSILSTGDKASVLVSFEDMLALQLGASTEVIFERIVTREDDPGARIVQLRCERGEILVASFFDSPDATVRIHTPTHTIVGTHARFEVIITDELITLTVLDGEVHCFLNEQPDSPITLLGGSWIAHPITKTAEGKKIVVGTEEQLASQEMTEVEKSKLETRLTQPSAVVWAKAEKALAAFTEVETKKIKQIIETCRQELEKLELKPCLDYVKWPLLFNEIPLDKKRLTEAFLEFTEPFDKLQLEIVHDKVTVTIFGEKNNCKAAALFPGTLEVTYRGTGLKRSRKFFVLARFAMVKDQWKIEELQILETWCPHVPYKEK